MTVEVYIPTTNAVPKDVLHKLERLVLVTKGIWSYVELFKEEVDIDESTGDETGNARTSVGTFHIEDLKKAVEVLEKALE